MMLSLTDNPVAVRSLIAIDRETIRKCRIDYARALREKARSPRPELWDLYLEYVRSIAEQAKQDIREIQNGTFTIELPDRAV